MNHGGTHHVQGRRLNRGTAKPSPIHHGSGKPVGVVHEAPTRPAVNSANFAGQAVKRK